MPTHSRRARERAAYTEELAPAAALGLGRTGIGLDEVTPGQRRLRALPAYSLFNTDSRATGLGGVHNITVYGVVVSPQHDRFVIVADTPHNVAGYLPSRSSHLGIPGLRLAVQYDREAYVFVHEPTGGSQIVVTSCRSTRDPDHLATRPPKHPRRHFLGTEHPVTTSEFEQLATIPPMSVDAERVLGALVARLTIRDPERIWAIGSWHDDPLADRGAPRRFFLEAPVRRLSGAHGWWSLEWTGYPYVDDLVAALIHPVVGVEGAVVDAGARGPVIRLGQASLTLCHRPDGLPDPSGRALGVRCRMTAGSRREA